MNLNTLYYLNVFLGSGAIVLQILSVVALFLLFFIPKEKNRNFYLDFIDKHFLVLSFLISLFASVFPLVYSEVANFLPCYLCWWQRIFMFPLVLMGQRQEGGPLCDATAFCRFLAVCLSELFLLLRTKFKSTL